MTQAPPQEDRSRQRRFITAVLVGVIAVGILGMLAAFLITDDGDAPGTVSRPGATIDPLSVEGKCRAAAVVRFEVTQDPGAAAEFTATGAVEPWVEKGENSLTTNTGKDSKLVSIGENGELPRVVLTVERQDAAWVVTETAGCLDAADNPPACATETLVVAKREYARDASAKPVRTGATGGYVGNGTLEPCSDPGKPGPRGVIAPVSVYAISGDPTRVVVTDDTGVRVYTR